MEKYSLLAKLAKCTLNIALKLTFEALLFSQMTVERREETLLFSLLSSG